MTKGVPPCPVLAAGCLINHHALVTGGGSGIGRAIAVRLAELGATVRIVGRHAAALEETCAMGPKDRILAVQGDIRQEQDRHRIINALPVTDGLDILVNNAGGQFYAAARDISDRGWDSVIDLNLNATFKLTRGLFDHLALRGGSVVNISLSGTERGTSGLAHSIAARAGVLGFSRTLALEWAKHDIRINCLSPGTVLSPAFVSAATPETVERLISATPAGRTTHPEEVAEMVAFLASSSAAMLTGQIFMLDGGAHIGPGLGMI